MKIYTYFEQDPKLRNFGEVLEQWDRRWKKAGLEPVILTEKDARSHPKFSDVYLHARKLPTVNPKAYEMACWVRWLAMETAGAELAVDSDVLPTASFKKDAFEAAMAAIHETTILDPGGVPCAVRLVGSMSDKILAFNTIYEEHGRPHTSDMLFFQGSGFPRTDMCREVGSRDWTLAPITHLATSALHKMGFPGKFEYNETLKQIEENLL